MGSIITPAVKKELKRDSAILLAALISGGVGYAAIRHSATQDLRARAEEAQSFNNVPWSLTRNPVAGASVVIGQNLVDSRLGLAISLDTRAETLGAGKGSDWQVTENSTCRTILLQPISNNDLASGQTGNIATRMYQQYEAHQFTGYSKQVCRVTFPGPKTVAALYGRPSVEHKNFG